MAEKYALIIACSEYQDARLSQLPKTEADAEGMRGVLVDERICGVPKGNLQLLVNAPDKAIRLAIEGFFRDRRKDDLLFFYFAGHGLVDDRRRLMLAVNETDPEYRYTGIDARWLREEMENSRSKRQVVILDCCNSGAFGNARDALGAPAGTQEALQGEGRIVLAASDKLQYSFDSIKGLEHINNGVFTHYLIQGLKTFAAVEKGGHRITVDSLYQYAHREVRSATENKQTPKRFVEDGSGSIVLARKPEPQLPVALQARLQDSNYETRIAAIYALKGAIVDGRDYADGAKKALHTVHRRDEHRRVYEAATHCLSDLGELPGTPQASAQNPAPVKRHSLLGGIIGVGLLIGAAAVLYWQGVNQPLENDTTTDAPHKASVDQEKEVGLSDDPQPTVVQPQSPVALPKKDDKDASAGEANEQLRQADARQRQEQIKTLLSSAAAKMKTKNLTVAPTSSKTAALEDYRAVLALEPDNPDAKTGIANIAQYFIDGIEQAFKNEKLDNVDRGFAKLTRVDPTHQRLAALRQQARFTGHLVAALKDIDAGRYDAAEQALERAEAIDSEVPRLQQVREKLNQARKAAVASKAYQPGEVFQDPLKSGGKGPEMVVIPAGTFMMGSPESEPERNDEEGPQHQVTFPKPFAIGKCEVTFEEYDRFTQATGRNKPSDQGWGRGRRPVTNVNWNDAQAYTRWFSEQTSKDYRLPSEAEWEYAARAGTTTPFHFGNTITTDQANFDGDGSYTYNGSAKGVNRSKTVPVGQFPANAFGLHDMHGDLWEWVADRWHGNYGGAPVDGSAWTKGGDVALRVLRGGSWSDGPQFVRSATRYGVAPDTRFDGIGFRLARTL